MIIQRKYRNTKLSIINCQLTIILILASCSAPGNGNAELPHSDSLQDKEIKAVNHTTSNTVAVKNEIWTVLEKKPFADVVKSAYQVEIFSVYELDSALMLNLLQKSKAESNVKAPSELAMIPVPFPDGSMHEFLIYETITTAPELLAKFPELKTFGGKDKADATAAGRFDFNANGFHAYVTTGKGEIFIEHLKSDRSKYIVFNESERLNTQRKPFE